MEFTISDVVNAITGILFHEFVVYALLATGLLFTLWSGFGQYRALTHGVSVIRGKFDKEGDPGAISHFQALSAALSATVGLGNIAGKIAELAVELLHDDEAMEEMRRQLQKEAAVYAPHDPSREAAEIILSFASNN